MNILKIGNAIFYNELCELGFNVVSIVDKGHKFYPADIEIDFFSEPQKAVNIVSDAIDKHAIDAVLLSDTSTPLIHLGLDTCNIPVFWYAVDSHIHEWHRYYTAIFDAVFCAQKNQVPSFVRYNKKSSWLPLSFLRPTPSFVPWNFRKHDVAFVGNVNPQLNPRRCRLFEKLSALGIPLTLERGDYVPLYTDAKIVVNQAVNDDLNYRFFEAPGCGALLISDELSHSMYDIMTPNIDYFLYPADNAEACADTIQRSLRNPEVSEAMAYKAYTIINQNHKPIHRVRQIASVIKGTSTRTIPSPLHQTFLAMAFEHCSRLNIPVHLADYFAGQALSRANTFADDPLAGPWANLVLGLVFLGKSEFGRAASYFSQIPEEPDNPDFKAIMAAIRPIISKVP